jgi:lysozyme
MQVSKNGVDFIKEFEGLKLAAYKDPGTVDGIPITIGYGSTMYTNGTKIKLGDVITEAEATAILEWEINNKTAVINGLGLKSSQNQFDALCSFVYNLGVGAFTKSTLLKKIKVNPQDPSIKDEFMKWVNNNGKVMKGLQRRRAAEVKLYFS